MRTLYAFLLILLPLYSLSQEYGYTRFDSKDGLASSTVYCMTQDAEGFMWFGTEAGLSRFDGTHFRTFTQEDGLPDNEVIQMFTDSRGRVWISPFKKTICYYYKGKIYTQENDPQLKRIQINNNVLRFAENDRGDILLMETNRLHLVTTTNEVYTITTIGNKPVKYLSAIGRNPAGGFWVIESNNLYEFSNRQFNLERTFEFQPAHLGFAAVSEKIIAIQNNHWEVTLQAVASDRFMRIPARRNQINFSIIDEEHVGLNTVDGTVVYNVNNPDSGQRFLPGVRVCGVLKDKEGNWWFSTLGQGLYRLNSAFVLNTKYRDYNVSHQVVSFVRDSGSVVVGCDMNIIHWLDLSTGKENRRKVLDTLQATDNVSAMYVNKDGNIVGGTAYILFLFSPGSRYYKRIERICVKGFYPYKEDVLVITNANIFRIDPLTLAVKDTIWRERATTAYAVNDTFYIGTLNGLYRLLPNGDKQFLGDRFAPFTYRIAAITRDTNNVMWVATFGGGLIAFKNEKIIAHLKQELTSNICRTVFLQDSSLWVGTNKGLNKININDTAYPVKKYTTGDGLVSDIVNVVYAFKNKVFVGTPEGLTYFDEEKIASQSRCDLRFINISIGGEAYYPDVAPVIIPHKKNSIQFDYVGISYKSSGDIRYRYRLLGLDTTWFETRETFLNFPALPSGEYELQLQAVNKFDVHSQVLIARFTVERLLYEKTWFKLLTGLLFLALTGLLVLVIVRRIRRREQEKTAISRRINDLEQLSRKAQMNPHFIFNSLNSIQQYVMDSDLAGANKFISGFSRLIRQTLDFSSKPEISLEEELDYLTNYLEIEKTRLENAFSWSVAIDKSVHPSDYYIPPMILQPFVENSVRHGLRYRRDKNGLVTITVKREKHHLVCILEDNGIGRKAAMRYKSVSPINYQSKGLSLTADRMAMYNQVHVHKITMKIDDLEDGEQNALGTRVTINFPIA
ncbi:MULTISPECIES: sensor histidine kinase [Niastella]|uniref:Histidine kinase n=1 Tax=Niastella soli TaxID=2821487 RepID=A0ABS3Z332_9BACT|nr:histidine kinase [Niastella soli]MBO9204578.1 histidine kinase [Niastella soli]